MANEDKVAIATQGAATAGPTQFIRAFKGDDPTGATFETQAMVPADETGKAQPQLMTEATAQAILAVLNNINNVLCDGLGVASYLDQK